MLGGEDVELFARMIGRGARFVAAADAIVVEYLPPERACLAWLLRRSFRNGGTIAHVTWRGISRGARIRLGLDALGQSVSFLLRALSRMVDARGAALRHALHSVESLGKAAWTIGLVHHEYRRSV